MYARRMEEEVEMTEERVYIQTACPRVREGYLLFAQTRSLLACQQTKKATAATLRSGDRAVVATFVQLLEGYLPRSCLSRELTKSAHPDKRSMHMVDVSVVVGYTREASAGRKL